MIQVVISVVPIMCAFQSGIGVLLNISRVSLFARLLKGARPEYYLCCLVECTVHTYSSLRKSSPVQSQQSELVLRDWLSAGRRVTSQGRLVQVQRAVYYDQLYSSFYCFTNVRSM